MQIGTQIKKFRDNLNMSQDDLANKIYVTRQTISNWENDKNYPDIHSLLLLSNLFNVSIDQLIKGDIETMKLQINEVNVEQFNKYSKVFAILFIIMIVGFVPLLVLFKLSGMFIWIIICIATLIFAIKVEKLKKDNDIYTYKEIVAFSEGRCLDEISKQKEIEKRQYQIIAKLLIGVAIGSIVALIGLFITKKI